MADSQSPFRLPTPQAQAYDTSSGELAVLKGMNPENMGMMYGMLLGQRAAGRQSQDQYSGLMSSIARQQEAIARQKMAADELENRRAFLLGGIQHGGLGVGATLQSAELPGLANFMSDQQRAQSVAASDANMQNLTAGRALQAAGAGLASGVEAGVLPNQGQAVAPGAAGMLGIRSTTGAPLDLTLEGMKQAGQRREGGTVKYGSKYNPLSNEIEYTAQGGDQQQVIDASRAYRAATAADAQARARATGGNMDRATGAGSAAGANRPLTQQGTPPPAPARSARLTDEQKSALAARLGAPVSHVERDPSGRRYAVGENGKRSLLPQ